MFDFQGPKGENVGSITQPLPSSYLIFRAISESDGELAPPLTELRAGRVPLTPILMSPQAGVGWTLWSWL